MGLQGGDPTGEGSDRMGGGAEQAARLRGDLMEINMGGGGQKPHGGINTERGAQGLTGGPLCRSLWVGGAEGLRGVFHEGGGQELRRGPMQSSLLGGGGRP